MKNKKNQLFLTIEKNSFVDLGDGKIQFKNGLVLTDNSEQRNGTQYDIPSMDISEYNGTLTANHSGDIQDIIGRVEGVRKIANRRVVADSVQFAIKENTLALYAYKMMTAQPIPYLTDFSIETFGPYPDESGVYHEAKLIGLSAVVTGNNRSARINEISEIAKNSIAEAKELGLDTSLVENEYLCFNESDDINNVQNKAKENDMKFRTIKNSKGYSVVVKFKNAAGDEIETEVKPGATIDVSEDQADAVQGQVDDATEPKVEPPAETATTAESLTAAVQNAVAPLLTKVNAMEKQLFDNGAREPMFKKSAESIKAEIGSMGWKQRHGAQVLNAWNWLKAGSNEAHEKLLDLNKINLEALQTAGKVENSVTIADMGNFVISPELLSQIEGFRSNFAPLISKLNFQETLSLQMAWLKRSGDISMSEVATCDDGANGNLKPISEYGAEITTSNLHELAAVTPVCNNATRFLAADLLSDVAAGYRNDYDRKRSQLFIARLQQAVNNTGLTSAYATTTALASLQSFIQTASTMQENVMGGYYILSQKSYWELVRQQIGAGIATDSGFRIFTTGDAGPLLLGVPYIVVPNELLPTLNSAETRSFVVEGVTVTINQAVFYVDLTTFSGRTSGGLTYDLSTEAAYEENSVVKSAFQRNELVLRGSFFRGGAIRDEDKVTGLGSRGVS